MLLRALLLLAAWPALAQHGGPIRGLAVAPDYVALSAGFDSTAILWRLSDGAVDAVLRFHADAVNAAIAMPDGSFATAGADGRIALWPRGATAPATVLDGHAGPIAALAAQADRLASGGWDGTVRLWSTTGPLATLEGHSGPVNGVAFLPDGSLASAGYDASLRLWPAEGGAAVVPLVAPQSALVATPDGVLLAAGADGRLRRFAPDGSRTGELELDAGALTALAVSPDGALVAVAALGGGASVVDVAALRVLAVLHTGERALWAIAFTPDGNTVLTGGASGVLRRFNVATGRPSGVIGTPVLPADQGPDPGARIFRACAACHSLIRDSGNRAGPSLHALFGRRIGTAPGYAYSAALPRLDVVWTAATVSRLFELGPAAVTPGSKMPEQVIADPADRAALVRFLERATR